MPVVMIVSYARCATNKVKRETVRKFQHARLWERRGRCQGVVRWCVRRGTQTKSALSKIYHLSFHICHLSLLFRIRIDIRLKCLPVRMPACCCFLFNDKCEMTDDKLNNKHRGPTEMIVLTLLKVNLDTVTRSNYTLPTHERRQISQTRTRFRPL